MDKDSSTLNSRLVGKVICQFILCHVFKATDNITHNIYIYKYSKICLLILLFIYLYKLAEKWWVIDKGNVQIVKFK